MSTKVAGSAAKDGYNNIRVYLQGQPAWIKAGNLVYASKENISGRNIVLIDLRSKKKSAAGRITRSVSIPYDSLDDRLDDIPRKAHIVLYSDSTEEAGEAVADLRGEGYKRVAIVEGNYSGWIKAGGKTVKGPVVTDIKWERKHGKNEVSKAEFLKALSGEDTSAVILDVRTNDETSVGGFKNAIAVPLDQISSHLDEIPIDKKIYTHCATGVRADMAAQELKKNGYKAFYLVASIKCEGNDCVIED